LGQKIKAQLIHLLQGDSNPRLPFAHKIA